MVDACLVRRKDSMKLKSGLRAGKLALNHNESMR